MSKLCVRGFSFSLDGYGAGPDQSIDNPLGKGGMALHQWAFATKTFRTMFGQDGGATGIDDDFAQRSFKNIGAWILGRNMFGPVRGPWPDESCGVATIKQYLRAGLIDEMHLVMSPVFMGTGENLFAGLDLPALGYVCTDRVSTPAATHLTVTKQA